MALLKYLSKMYTQRHMDVYTSKLAVLLLAEGTVRVHNNKSYIVFTNTSPSLQKLFKDLAVKLDCKVFRKSPKQWAIYSKPLAKKLLAECKSFRSKPCDSGLQNACPATTGKSKKGASCSICMPVIYMGRRYPPSAFPRSVTKADKKRTAEYLRLFFTCEGGVVIGTDKRNDEVVLRVGHPTLREQAMQMLSKLDITAGLRGESLIFVKKRSEVLKFREKIGFVPGAKSVRGVHVGHEKNKLLDVMIERHGFV